MKTFTLVKGRNLRWGARLTGLVLSLALAVEGSQPVLVFWGESPKTSLRHAISVKPFDAEAITPYLLSNSRLPRMIEQHVENSFSRLLQQFLSSPERDSSKRFHHMANLLSRLSSEEQISVFQNLAWFSDSPFVQEFILEILRGKTPDAKSLRNRLFMSVMDDESKTLFWSLAELSEAIDAVTMNSVTSGLLAEQRSVAQPHYVVLMALLFGSHEAERRAIRSSEDLSTLKGRQTLFDHYWAEAEAYVPFAHTGEVVEGQIEYLKILAMLEMDKAAVIRVRAGRPLSTVAIETGLKKLNRPPQQVASVIKIIDNAFEKDSTQTDRTPIKTYIRLKGRIRLRQSYAEYLRMSRQTALLPDYEKTTQALVERLKAIKREQQEKLAGPEKTPLRLDTVLNVIRITKDGPNDSGITPDAHRLGMAHREYLAAVRLAAERYDAYVKIRKSMPRQSFLKAVDSAIKIATSIRKWLIQESLSIPASFTLMFREAMLAPVTPFEPSEEDSIRQEVNFLLDVWCPQMSLQERDQFLNIEPLNLRFIAEIALDSVDMTDVIEPSIAIIHKGNSFLRLARILLTAMGNSPMRFITDPEGKLVLEAKRISVAPGFGPGLTGANAAHEVVHALELKWATSDRIHAIIENGVPEESTNAIFTLSLARRGLLSDLGTHRFYGLPSPSSDDDLKRSYALGKSLAESNLSADEYEQNLEEGLSEILIHASPEAKTYLRGAALGGEAEARAAFLMRRNSEPMNHDRLFRLAYRFVYYYTVHDGSYLERRTQAFIALSNEQRMQSLKINVFQDLYRTRMQVGLHTVTARKAYETLADKPSELASLAKAALDAGLAVGLDQLAAVRIVRQDPDYDRKPLIFLLEDHLESAKEAVLAGINILQGRGWTWDIVQSLRQNFPEVLIMAEITYDSVKAIEDLKEVLFAGVDGLLLKPYKAWNEVPEGHLLSLSALRQRYPDLLMVVAQGVFESTVASVLARPERLLAAVGTNKPSLLEFKSQIHVYMEAAKEHLARSA
jgi:hypothetical protein